VTLAKREDKGGGGKGKGRHPEVGKGRRGAANLGLAQGRRRIVSTLGNQKVLQKDTNLEKGSGKPGRSRSQPTDQDPMGGTEKSRSDFKHSRSERKKKPPGRVATLGPRKKDAVIESRVHREEGPIQKGLRARGGMNGREEQTLTPPSINLG